MNLQFQSIAAAPDKVLLIIESPAGPLKQAFNGSIGWVKGPNGITQISGSGLERMKDFADFYRDVNLKDQYTSLKLVGETLVGSKEVFEVRGEKASGAAETLYLDSKTGLLVRRVTQQKTPFGLRLEAVDFDDYRDFGGVKVPLLVKRRGAGNVATFKYDEVTQNAPVDDAEFEKPAGK